MTHVTRSPINVLPLSNFTYILKARKLPFYMQTLNYALYVSFSNKTNYLPLRVHYTLKYKHESWHKYINLKTLAILN